MRFALRHLKEKHPETLEDPVVMRLKMPDIMEKYFVWDYYYYLTLYGIIRTHFISSSCFINAYHISLTKALQPKYKSNYYFIKQI